jgi:hypothetical protein
MTLPDERYRAVIQTQKLLLEILNTPRVPKSIKDGARHCLRHYPSNWDMRQAATASPHLFAEHMEPVTRLFAQYEQSRAEQNEPPLPDEQ